MWLPVSRRCSRKAAKWSRSPHRPMPLPSKHPGVARQSRSRRCNARKLSPFYATENMERVHGKHERLQTVEKSAACPNPLDKEEKKKQEKKVLDPEEYPVPCANGPPMSYPCCRRHPATVLPLRPHQCKRRRRAWQSH